MKSAIHEEESLAIIYDRSQMDLPAAEHFTAGYWQDRNAVRGQAIGRGSAWFIDTSYGSIVLRQYLRGGWIAKISHEHYIFTGVSTSRPFREFKVLATLYELGLPVPRPVAAICKHRGILSTGTIMTARVDGARSLAELLSSTDITQGQWPRQWHGRWADVGRCIHRFHSAGLWHADLNAGNILIDGDSSVYLIDFDRARFTPGVPVNGKNNLSRLNRSLVKLWPESDLSTLHTAWDLLMKAYHG
jgi:3-deoxy-D-manno-octulosonic acid kinase